MSEPFKYKDLQNYLRTCPVHDKPQGFGDLLCLVLAGVDNLRENMTGEEMLENAHMITESQARFLQQLLDNRAESIEWYKDNIGHSSHTGLL